MYRQNWKLIKAWDGENTRAGNVAKMESERSELDRFSGNSGCAELRRYFKSRKRREEVHKSIDMTSNGVRFSRLGRRHRRKKPPPPLSLSLCIYRYPSLPSSSPFVARPHSLSCARSDRFGRAADRRKFSELMVADAEAAAAAAAVLTLAHIRGYRKATIYMASLIPAGWHRSACMMF